MPAPAVKAFFAIQNMKTGRFLSNCPVMPHSDLLWAGTSQASHFTVKEEDVMTIDFN